MDWTHEVLNTAREFVLKKNEIAKEVFRAVFPVLSSMGEAQARFLKVLLKYYEGPATDETLQFINAILDDWSLLDAERVRLKNQTESTKLLWPGWELRQVGPGVRKLGPGEWWQRWKAAGDACKWKGASRLRFIALKNSPIWSCIGRGVGGYGDTYGFAHPPFAIGDCSSFWDVTPKVCREAGIFVPKGRLNSNSQGTKDILKAIRRYGMPKL